MTVGNEKYRCTVHEIWEDCCAIEYILHNLDYSTEVLLRSKKEFFSSENNEKPIKTLE